MVRWRQMWNRELLRQRKFWAALGVVALAHAVLIAWGVRSYQRGQARDTLNEYAPFRSPPLEIMFHTSVVGNESNREVLEPGRRAGIWLLRERGGKPPSWEVRLTDQGQRWFSTAGNQVVAAFKAGTRQVTRVLDLERTFPHRRVRFRYVWSELHPGSIVLGANAPGVGREYDGEALFTYEHDRWQVLHWSAPDFDEAVARFKTIESVRQ